MGRRVVNAYCATDLVLAGVGRLHEVLGEGRVSTMAGMAPVASEDGKKDIGIENVDLGEIIKGEFPLRLLPVVCDGRGLVLTYRYPNHISGHFELNEKMGSILETVGVNV